MMKSIAMKASPMAKLRPSRECRANQGCRPDSRERLTRSLALPLLVVFLAATAFAQNTDVEPLKEKTVYVPYERLQEVFEKEGRGIFLPYKEFLDLWQRAQPKPKPPEGTPPPAEAVIAGGEYKGSVAEGLATFSVSYSIEALKENGWSTLELPLRNVAVEKATIRSVQAPAAGASAPREPPLVVATKDGYAVYLPRKGSYELELTLSVRVHESPGRRSIAFDIPPAAVSRIDLVIPEENAQLEVTPMMAATKIEERDGATRVLAFVGNSSNVTVSWSPPAGKLEEEKALFSARQAITATLGERVLRLDTTISFEIHRHQVDRFRIELPRDMQVFRVTQNVRQWEVVTEAAGADGAEGQERQLLEVRLHAPVSDTYQLELSFERILAETPERIDMPLPRVEGAVRESGVLALAHDPGLKVRVTTSDGLGQRNVADLPEALRGNAFVGFRYLAHPITLTLEVEQILPVIRTETTSVVVFGVDEDQWVGWIDYKITRAGVFSLAFQVPSRWDVEHGEFDEAVVDDYQTAPVEGDADSQVITVNLKTRAFGDFRLPFRLTAVGSASAGAKTVVAPRPLNVQGDRGLLGVGGPRAFRITTGDRTGTVAVDTQELSRSGIQTVVPQEDTVVDLAFSFHDHPASVNVTLEERKTEIKVTSRVLVNVTNNDLQVSQDLEYLVEYAAVDTLSFTAPTAYDDRLQVHVKGERDQKKTQIADGRTRWDIVLQSRVLGVRTVSVTFREGLESAPGMPATVSLPLIRAEGATTAEGSVAIRKEGNLEVDIDQTGLERIDRRELPPELARGRIHDAYAFARPDYQLALKLTRYQPSEVPDAIVNLLLSRGHLSRERILDTDAVLIVQNFRLQHLEFRLPDGARNARFFVNGSDRGPQRVPGGGDTDLRIPLRDERGTVVVRVRYQVPLGDPMGAFGGFVIKTPVVRTNATHDNGAYVPVERVELELYAPREYVYLLGAGTLYASDPEAGGALPWATAGIFTNVVSARTRPAARARYGSIGVPPLPLEFARPDLKFFQMKTYQPEGVVSISFVGTKSYTLLNVVIFAVVLAGGILTLRRVKTWRWWIVLVGAAVMLLFAWLSSPAVSVLWLSAYRAGLVLAIGLAFFDGVPRVREGYSVWRAERMKLVPDPYLEDAFEPPATTAPPAANDQPQGQEIEDAVAKDDGDDTPAGDTKNGKEGD